MGAISWTDNCGFDTDGTPNLSATGATVSYDSAYPGANMLTNDPSLVAQIDVTGSGSGSIKVNPTWNAGANDRTVRLAAALNVRIPSGITGLAITARAIAFGGSTLASSTASYGATDLVPIPGTTDRYDLFFPFTADVSAAAISLEFAYSANPGSIYLEIGRLWAGPALVLGWGTEFSVEFIDPSTVERGPGGSYAAQVRPRRKALNASFLAKTYAEALGTAGAASTLSLRHLAMEAGQSSPVVAVARTDSLHFLQTEGVFGLLTELPNPEHLGSHRFDARMRVEQVR